LLLAGVAAGCQSDQEALAEFCTELERVQSEPGSCDELGERMLALTEENSELLQKVRDMDAPPAEELDGWHRAMRPCFEAHLQVGLSNCAENPKVQEALTAFGE